MVQNGLAFSFAIAYLFLKNGLTPASFCLFTFFSKTNLQKIVDFNGIRIQIVGVEGEHAEHNHGQWLPALGNCIIDESLWHKNIEIRSNWIYILYPAFQKGEISLDFCYRQTLFIKSKF